MFLQVDWNANVGLGYKLRCFSDLFHCVTVNKMAGERVAFEFAQAFQLCVSVSADFSETVEPIFVQICSKSN